MSAFWHDIVIVGTLVGTFAVVVTLIALFLLGAGIIAMTSMLVVTRKQHAKEYPVTQIFTDVPLTIWSIRWVRFLRHILRRHHTVAGEEKRIEQLGLGAWLRGDELFSWKLLYTVASWTPNTPLVRTYDGLPLVFVRFEHRFQGIGAQVRRVGERKIIWMHAGQITEMWNYQPRDWLNE